MSKVTIKFFARFCLGIIFDSPHSKDAIGFDIAFEWKVPKLKEKWESSNVLRLSPFEVERRSGFEFLAIPIRYLQLNSPRPPGPGTLNKAKIRFGTGRRAAKFPILSLTDSWNVDYCRFSNRVVPHVFNYLRRQRLDVYDEWDGDFRESIWDSRRTVDNKIVSDFARRWIRACVRHAAQDKGCTPRELMEETHGGNV